MLQIPDTPQTTKDQVAAAILQWNATEFEQEAVNRGMCVSACRSFDEWDKHPQAATLIGKPPLTITRINAAPKRSLPQRRHPLQGFRVLDLSRVLAGPIAGRTLAGGVSSFPTDRSFTMTFLSTWCRRPSYHLPQASISTWHRH
jgi:crotonobetainyl-CoA:carnitine CoA-transferase CaiB-like acyl-CoA transferase